MPARYWCYISISYFHPTLYPFVAGHASIWILFVCETPECWDLQLFSSELGFLFYCLGLLTGYCCPSQVPITIFQPPLFFHRKTRKKGVFSKASLLAGFHAQTLIIALPGKGKELFLECPTAASKDFPRSPFLLIKAQLLTALGSLWVRLVCNVSYLEFMS